MEKLGSPEHAPPSLGAEPVAGHTAAKAEGEEAVAAATSKLSQCAWMKRWLPLAYRVELYQVLKLTGPLLLSRILTLLMTFVISMFCGHIGNTELAGFALASATINVTTTSTGHGLALACDTLISQTFGGKNMKRVGVILQRSSLILLMFCLPCWALLMNAHSLLLLMKQEVEVVRIAQIYLMAYLPAVPALLLYNVQVAYLQNQGIILPQMYTAAVANILNVGVNYVLIFSLEWGVIGSAIANSLTQISLCLLLFGYIRWKKLHVQTWGGWSTDCLQEWGSYMKLATPSTFMVWFEWWIWEFGAFFAGILGEKDLAAQHIIVEIGGILYMLPLGIQGAACVRVGNALGAGDTARAIVTCKVTLALVGLLAVFLGIFLFSSRFYTGLLFTTDNEIIEIVAESLIACTFVQFFDSLLCICSGILIGCGMQKFAALSNLVGYYIIGLPIGVALIFYAHLRILGLWLGILVCVSVEVFFFLMLIFKLDWKKVTEKAQKRAGKKVVGMLKRQVSTELSEVAAPEASLCSNNAQSTGDNVQKSDGYSPVNTQDQEVKAAHEAEGNNADGDAEQSKHTSDPKPQQRLSVTQLFLRRGLVVLISVLTLVVGIVLHIALPIGPPAESMSNSTLNWLNVSTPTPWTPVDLTASV